MTLDQIEARADEVRALLIRKLSMDEQFAEYRRANQGIPQEMLDDYIRVTDALRDAL